MKKIVGDMSEWSGILKDLFRQIDDGSIGRSELQAFLEHRTPFFKESEEAGCVAEWQEFYRDVFGGMDVDFSDLQIPEKQEGFDRLIVMAQGISAKQAYDKCKKLFPCRKWDEALEVESDRKATEGAYAIWVRGRVEADEELKNLSANDLEKRAIPGITLEERLIFELKWFKETEKHLDVESWTLCAGSRCPGGDVPGVSWGGDELFVFRCLPSGASSRLRPRQVVS